MSRPPCRDEQAEPLASPIHGPSGDINLPPMQATSPPQVPCNDRLCPQPTQGARELQPELQDTAQNRLVEGLKPVLGRELFSIAGADGDAQVKLNGMQGISAGNRWRVLERDCTPCPVVSHPNWSDVVVAKLFEDLHLLCEQALTNQSPPLHWLASWRTC